MKHEDAIRFGLWAQEIGFAPSPEQILARFPDVSRATAYRWRNALLLAWGVEPTGDYLRTASAPKLRAA